MKKIIKDLIQKRYAKFITMLIVLLLCSGIYFSNQAKGTGFTPSSEAYQATLPALTKVLADYQKTSFVAANYTSTATDDTNYMTTTATSSAFSCGTSTFGRDSNIYGTVLGADSKCWLDRNLGASRVATSYSDTQAYGWYFQWGRGVDGHQISTSAITTTNSSSNTPGNASFISESTSPYDWRVPQNNSLWQGVSGVNNPCPTGFRLPTSAEWTTLVNNAGITSMANAYTSTLKLVSSDFRYNDGIMSGGNFGRYWSSTISGTNAMGISLNPWVDNAYSNYRAYGYAVRCINESSPVTSLYATQIYTFNPTSFTDYSKLDISLVANGTASAGNGITAKIWNKTTLTWDALASLTNTSATMPSSVSTQSLSTGISNYVDASNKIRVLVSTINPSISGTSAVLKTDYIKISVLGAPSVTTSAVTSIAATTATGNGNVTATNGENPTRYIEWGTSSGTYPNSCNASTGSTGAYACSMTGLSPATTYYYRAKVVNSISTGYGSEMSFTTSIAASTVTTQSVTSITAAAATGNGNITITGGNNPTRYIEWGTSSGTYPNSCNAGVGSTGAYTCSITGLSAKTTYYVRAKAINSAGTTYGSEVSFITLATTPTVTTQTASAITSNAATGNGNITSTGNENPTRYIEWGTVNGTYPNSCNAGTGSTGAYVCAITGLSPKTTYYIRARATNSAGTTYGTGASFTTLAIAPTVTTQTASSITYNSATGNGNITVTGGENPTRYIEWGTVSGAYPNSCNASTGSTGAYTCAITGLSPNTTYYVRAKATNSAGTTYGTETSFTTAITTPTVTTSAASAITTSSATLNGSITSTGGSNPTRYVEYGTSSGSYPQSCDAGTGGVGAYSCNITSLNPNAIYYFRARAVNSAGTTYGSEASFTTTVGAPIVSTADASSVTTNSATLNANLINVGGENPTRTLEWGISTGSYTNSCSAGTGVAGAYSCSAGSLSPNTLYYFRAKASNTAGTSYGSELTFTTLVATPTVTTQVMSSVTSATATGNGTIAVTGGEDPTRIIEWGTATNSYTQSCNASTGSTGTYSCSMTGLSPNTKYYYRAKAINSGGTGYGSEMNFTTPTLPVITITNPNNDPAQSKTLTATTDKGTLTQSITTGSLCDNSLTFSTYQSTTFSTEADNGKKICYKSDDVESGIAYLMSDAITNIDTTNPTISANNDSSNWQTTNPTITLSSSDTNLSYSKYIWDVNDCVAAGINFNSNDTINIPSEGIHTLYLCNEDLATNTSSWNGNYKLDTIAPSISLVTPSCTNTTDPTFTISATDTNLDTTPYSFDAGATWQTQNVKTYTDLSHTIAANTIQVKDQAGNIQSYQTPITQACVTTPTVSTGVTTAILTTTATGNGTILNTGNENPTRTIQWGKVSGVYTDSCSAGVGGLGDFSCDLTNLLPPDTTYYLRAKATNSAGTSYGEEVTFKTLPTEITIINPDTTKMTDAISSGYAKLDSGAITATPQVTTVIDIIMKSTNVQLSIPNNTQITNTDSGNFNFQNFTTQNITSTVKQEIAQSKAAVKIGLANTKLTFSQPITLVINIDPVYNDTTMDIFYQNEGETDWHSQGSCKITSGTCTFTTTHATNYTINGNGTMAGDTGINLNTDVQEVISLDCGTPTINLGNLTPGTPVTGSSTCTATTNANGGYTLAVKRDDATSTLKKNSENNITISDLTPWDPTTPNSNTYSGTGLGFTVYHSTANKNSSWWGTGSTLTDSNNKYAGFNTNQTDIMRDTSYSETSTATDIGYKIDVPPTQKSGAYSGAITYQVTTAP